MGREFDAVSEGAQLCGVNQGDLLSVQYPVQALRSQVVTGPPHWPALKAACVQVVTVASQGFYSQWFIDFPAASHLTSLGEC